MMLLRNKRILRLLASVLAAMLVLLTAGCGSTAATALSFGDVKITENTYCYWMSKYKAMYLYTMFGTTTDNAQYWTYDMGGFTTGAYFGAMALTQIQSNAVLLGLFDEYGLSLSTEQLNSIDSAIQQFITATGSKAALNSALSAYGVNSDMLRDIYIMEAKISAVQTHLYGEGGLYTATEDELDEYFNANYYRCKHILIRTDVKYERDADGVPIVDEETQSYKTIALTAAEIEEQKALAADLEKRVAAGEDYDKLVVEYSEDTGMQRYDDGYYITSATTFLPSEITSAVTGMKVGEVKTVESSYGISIVKRYALKDKAYNEDPYKSEQIGDLAATVNTVKLQELVNSYSGSIVLNEDVINRFPFSNLTPDFYY